MMKHYIEYNKYLLMVLILALFFLNENFAQDLGSIGDTICNQSVVIKRWAKVIPKDICIPKGYIISDINNKIDFDEDGLNDFVITWNKESLNDGDTIFVTFYKEMADSLFMPFRIFNHLYPPVFNSYSSSYLPKDTSLLRIKRKFSPYPLRQIEFKGSLINLRIRIDAEGDFLIRYKFDKKIKNWGIVDAFEISEYNDTVNYAPVFGPTIDDFTYEYWDKFYRFKGWKK